MLHRIRPGEARLVDYAIVGTSRSRLPSQTNSQPFKQTNKQSTIKPTICQTVILSIEEADS